MKELITKWKDDGKRILVVYVPVALASVSKRFFESFIAMTGPDIQEELDRKYGVKMVLMPHDTFPIDLNRNEAFDLAISKYEADYLMCCDADQVFKPYTILKLMEYLTDEIDAVTGIYFRKTPPHRCVVGKFSPWSEHLENKREALKSQMFIADDGQQTLYYKPLMYFDVVQPIHVFGMGCILFKTECFKKLERPYFKYVNGHSTSGDFTFVGHSEDMWLCSQMYKKGMKVLCNPKVIAGHLVEKVIMGNEAED